MKEVRMSLEDWIKFDPGISDEFKEAMPGEDEFHKGAGQTVLAMMIPHGDSMVIYKKAFLSVDSLKREFESIGKKIDPSDLHTLTYEGLDSLLELRLYDEDGTMKRVPLVSMVLA